MMHLHQHLNFEQVQMQRLKVFCQYWMFFPIGKKPLMKDIDGDTLGDTQTKNDGQNSKIKKKDA